MTLIVARVVDGRALLVGDSKVTYGTDDRRLVGPTVPDRRIVPTPLDWQLKVIAISPHLAVAYSSSELSYALTAIRDAANHLRSNDAQSLASLLSTETRDGSHEFMVADRTSLRFVRSGDVHVATAGAIGDQAAGEFQGSCRLS